MLQFWKKASSPQKIRNGSSQVPDLDAEISIRKGPLSRFKCLDFRKLPCDKSSRLSLTPENVLQNKTALSYLSQYMEVRGYANLFNLLADVEGLPFRLQPHPQSPASAQRTFKQIMELSMSEDAPFPVIIPDSTMLPLIESDARNQLKTILLNLIKKDVWNDFLKSDWHCKYQIEIMTSGTMTLSDVLYNDSCLDAFLDFLDSERLSSVLEFWLSATSFEKQYKAVQSTQEYICTDSKSIQDDAIAIYEKYLSLQATTPLGMCDKVRFAVEEGICGETTTSPECLRPAQVAVEEFLSRSCLKSFLSSQQYLALLSDVMLSTTSSTSMSKSNLSPASSVTEGSQDHSRVSQSDVEGLWKRCRHYNGLSFGRIDQFGRYETDIEPEPEKKSESRITRVVKLLMNKDEQKAQEEMAWRVAEMIVKDITSVTMGGTHEDV